jgi:glutamate-1-semialdehyde 2,1-aminomutase
VFAYSGEGVWDAMGRGEWSRELFDAALAQARHAAPGDPRPNCRPNPEFPAMPSPVAFVLEHADGLRSAHIMLHGHLSDFTFALRLKGAGGGIRAGCSLIAAGDAGNFYGHFATLDRVIEDMFLTGEPPVPIERTLLTTKTIAACMKALRTPGKAMPTPELAIAYHGRPAIRYLSDRIRLPPPAHRGYARSAALYERACRVLAGGVSSEFRKASQPHPLFYARGQGSRIWDVDGNEYLDFTLSQGPLILGHGHPEVLDAVGGASAGGQLFAGQHLAELELSERLQRLIPCAERLRFSLSGSEAVHAALRLARAATGRPKFLRFEGHYHGWLDNVAFGIAGLGPWTDGLPDRALDEAVVLPWNDLAAVERTLASRAETVAAVLTEPVMCNSGCIPPRPGFLEGLRDLCDRYGVLLVFDEVITGFRLGLGGAQAHSGVTPDLAVFGKALASGYPISVLAGRERWMRRIADGGVIHAGTMNAGNPCVAAALATLDVLERENVPAGLGARGRRLMQGLRAAAEGTGRPLLVQGPGPMFHAGFTDRTEVNDYRDTLAYDKSLYAHFVARMQERGVRLIGRGLWYVSHAHTDEDLDQAVDAARHVLARLG